MGHYMLDGDEFGSLNQVNGSVPLDIVGLGSTWYRSSPRVLWLLRGQDSLITSQPAGEAG
jgi:hypothetical protein